jgi:hypothetical protein
MTDVFKWPPVSAYGPEWTMVHPVSVSRSLMTGARSVSQFQVPRRVARLEVSAMARGGIGAGYMEVLKRLLAGGVGLVRLYSYPINGAHVPASVLRSGDPLGWDTETDTSLVWTGPISWLLGAALVGTPGTSGGWDIVTVTGLPSSVLVARPGEFLTAYEDEADTMGTAVMIQAPAYSDETGTAVIRVVTPIAAAGRVNIGRSDTGVFEALSIPRAPRQIGADWVYSWEFREVFEDEVAGGFTEVDPWN